MEFSRQECWSGLPFPTPGNLPNPGIEPTSLMSPGLAGRFFTTSPTWEVLLSKEEIIARIYISRNIESRLKAGVMGHISKVPFKKLSSKFVGVHRDQL